MKLLWDDTSKDSFKENLSNLNQLCFPQYKDLVFGVWQIKIISNGNYYHVDIFGSMMQQNVTLTLTEK